MAIQTYIDKRGKETYFSVQGINYSQGRKLQSQGWRWARGNSDGKGFWFHTEEKIALPAFERLNGIKPIVLR